MAWNDCPMGDQAQSNEFFSCSTNLGSSSLYCAFSLAQPVDQVVTLELVVDLQHSSITLPDYWRLGPFPDCRHDLLTASLDFSATNACTDPAFAGAAVQDFLPGQPGGLASQARIKATVFLPSPQIRSFNTDETYLAVRLVLSHDRTAATTGCAGCEEPACLVFNSVLMRRAEGASGGDRWITTPGPNSSNWVTWHGGVGADCALVPVRRPTWGAIKSLYR